VRSFLCNELEPFSYLIYVLALLLQLRHERSIGYKVLSVYYMLYATIIYIGIAYFESNTWTYNLLFFGDVLILSWYYQKLFDTKIKKRLTITCALFNTIIFVYINIISLQYSEYNDDIYGISFITIVLYALLYLHQLLINIKEESLLLNFNFWLVCGYLLYFLGAFFIILYYDHFKNYLTRGDMWQIHNIILFICSAVTFIASLQISKKNNLQHV
jgi:hypothetical protein